MLIAVAFSTPAGIIPDNAPTPEELVANAWFGLESMAADGGFSGLPGFEPVVVAPGVFAPCHRTVLGVVALEQDAVILPADLELLVP